jgi:peroxiredoxin
MWRNSGWLVALVAFLVFVYITINTLRSDGPGSSGIAAGRQLPPFAVPLALSDLTGDANVATRGHEGAAGHRPACDVTDPRALNVCTLEQRGPVVLAFLVTGSSGCDEQLDAMQRLTARFPQVGFAAVAIKGDRAKLRTLVRTHGWSFPVAQDADGAVANLYGVAVCPTVVFAYRGGRVRETAIGTATVNAATLSRKVGALLAGPPPRSG